MTFSRNEEIYGEAEPADFVYRVLSGVARTVRFLSDGRRQVVAFHFPGDVFGIEAGSSHRFSAEAVCASELALIKRSTISKIVQRDCAAAAQLLDLTTQELRHAHDHALLLGHKSASERVAAFLLEISERYEGNALNLPMSRMDIADYLGLTIETVSRTFTQLERQGVLSLESARHVVVERPAALQSLSVIHNETF